MKNFIILLCLLSSLAWAQNNPAPQSLGKDVLAGSMRLEIADGPVIFETKIWTKNVTGASVTDPFVILSAFDVCNGRDLVPRFLDTNAGKGNGEFYNSRTFKCVGGDLDDWKRLLRQQCANVKPIEQEALANYCMHLGRKLGDDYVKCKGPCEKVQDPLLAQ